MATQPPRNYTRLAIAIVVAGLVVGAGIFSSSVFRTTVITTTTATVSSITSSSVTYTSCTSIAPTGVAPCTVTTTFIGTTTPSISIQVNGSAFEASSPILVSGDVNPISPSEKVLVSVENPDGNLVSIAYVPINSSLTGFGAYSYLLVPSSSGCGWIIGTYTVVGTFVLPGLGGVANVALTTFQYTPLAAESSPSTSTCATVSSSLVSTLTTTSTVTSPAECPNGATCASFAYGPTGQVQVLSVQATQFVCQNCGAVNGQSYLAFEVALENIGNSSVYIAGGTSELSVSIPANSSVISAVPSEVCAGTFTIIELGQGQNYTLGGPPCDDGLDYQVVQAGTVSITFSFDWTTNPAANTFPDSTTISAEFAFA